MTLQGRQSNKDQMYDEKGIAFYPVTHKDCIIGGVQDLDVGITLSKIDLTACITVGLTGTLMIKSFNSIIYTFVVDLREVNNDPFEIDKDILLARDIPDMVGKVEFNAVGAGVDGLKVWLDNGYLKARILKRTQQSYDGYVSEIRRIIASGTIIR